MTTKIKTTSTWNTVLMFYYCSYSASESNSKSGMPALRQRSASLGKVGDSDNGSKRKRDPSLDNEQMSSPEPPVLDSAEGSDMSSTEVNNPGPSDVGPLAKRRKSIKSDNVSM